MCMLDCAAALHWHDIKVANNWQTILTNSVQWTAESVSVAAAARRPGCIQQPSRLSVSTVIPRFKNTRSELRKKSSRKSWREHSDLIGGRAPCALTPLLRVWSQSVLIAYITVLRTWIQANWSNAVAGSGRSYDTIRYDTRCYFNVRSKADISRLNLPHGTDN